MHKILTCKENPSTYIMFCKKIIKQFCTTTILYQYKNTSIYLWENIMYFEWRNEWKENTMHFKWRNEWGESTMHFKWRNEWKRGTLLAELKFPLHLMPIKWRPAVIKTGKYLSPYNNIQSHTKNPKNLECLLHHCVVHLSVNTFKIHRNQNTEDQILFTRLLFSCNFVKN